MNILIYLGHPAQYHFFKNAIPLWKEHGHKVSIVIKKKDILEKLLQEDGLDYINIEPFIRKRNILFFFVFIRRIFKILQVSIYFKPNVFIGTEPSLAYAACIYRKPCISVGEDDYDVVKSMLKVSGPLTSCFLSPDVCNLGKWERKKVSYKGYMKLAYLHPNRFDNTLSSKLNLGNYCFIRLVSLTACHDGGIQGITYDLLDKMIERIERAGLKIYISSEKKLSSKYARFLLHIPLTSIHTVLSNAKLVICDSQSMTVESAVLGTPSIRISSFVGRISVLNELEQKYELTYGFMPTMYNDILEKLDELLLTVDLKGTFLLKREKMLSDKIDVTSFLVWFVENYPESKSIMERDCGYQNRFK